MNEQTKRTETFAIQTMTKFIEFRWKWYSCAYIFRSLSLSLSHSLTRSHMYTHGLPVRVWALAFVVFISLVFVQDHFRCVREQTMNEPTMRQQQQHRAKNNYKRWRRKKNIILLCSTECVQVIVLMRHIVSLHSTWFIEIHSHVHTSIFHFFCTHSICIHSPSQAYSFFSSFFKQFTRYYFSFIISILFNFFFRLSYKKCVPYVCRVKSKQ